MSIKKFFKNRRTIAVLIDLLLPILWIVFLIISDYMLENETVECPWAAKGFECGTCGGTRCVNSLLRFKWGAAFFFNPVIFIAAFYVAIGIILLNVYLFFGNRLCLQILQKMFGVCAIIIWLVGYFLFILFRNLPVLIKIFYALLHYFGALN